MQAMQHHETHERYAKCIEVSKRIRWEIDRDVIRGRKFDVLWPTHGPPVIRVEPFIRAYIDHRRAREAQVLKAVSEGHGRIKEMGFFPTKVVEVDKSKDAAAKPA